MLIEQFDPNKIITAVYLDQDKNQYNIKRFKIETSTLKSQFLFIKEGAGNRLEAVSTEDEPILVVQTGRGQQVPELQNFKSGQDGGSDGMEGRRGQADRLQQNHRNELGARGTKGYSA